LACYRATPDGLILTVRLTPRANRDSVDGVSVLSDGREVAVARVRAVPERGAANQALTSLVATALKVPKSAVAVVAGSSARLKQLRIAGDAALLARTISGWPKR
jgi:uncharacterized protein YggU (UPF0235/DUF167 family)